MNPLKLISAKLTAAMVAVALLIVPVVVRATLITETLTVTGSNFALHFGSPTPPPVSPLIIDFTVTFDNAADVSPTTTGLIVHSFNAGYPVQFAYSHSLDQLILASVPLLPSDCDISANTFCIFIHNASSASPSASEVQQTTSSGANWFATTISTTVGVVPEPATLALLGVGLAGIGFARRRRM